MAPLLLAAHKVVRVVAGEVGAKGGAEIGVLIVVALHVERLGAAAALRHAVVDEVIQGLIFASVCPFVNIWILIEIVVGIENRRIIKPRGFGELRDDGIRISFSKTFAPGITKVLVRIAPIGDKSVFNQNTGDSSFTSTTNNGEFVAYLHLKDTTVCKSESNKIVLNLLGQFVRNLGIVSPVHGRRIYLGTMSCGRTRIDVETDIGLSALFDATLNAVKEVVASVTARLLTSENYLKSVILKLGLTRANNLPS